jgi:probable phosphoglycerate mutase
VSARTIIWLRHGRTAWNEGGRFQGQTDVPLDDRGIRQAEAAAAVLAGLAPSRVVASDLDRARSTAAPLLAATGLPEVLDPRLRETYAGSWEGLTHREIRARDGDALDRWAAGDPIRPGGGELRTEVAERVDAAVREALSGLAADGPLVVVTHGGAARAGIGRMLGLPPEHWGVLGVLSNCCWSVLVEHSRDGAAARWRLAEYNAGSLPVPALGDDR